jgi:hypothetical protein
MSDKTPDLKDDTNKPSDVKPEAPAAAELTEKDLDQAAGGLWPWVKTGSTYNPTI